MSAAKETIIRLDKSQNLPFHAEKQESKPKNPPVWLHWASMLIALLLTLGCSIMAPHLDPSLDGLMEDEDGWKALMLICFLTFPFVYIEYVMLFFAHLWVRPLILRWKADKKFYTNGRWPKLLWIFSHNLVKTIQYSYLDICC